MSYGRLLRLYEVGKSLFYNALRVTSNFFEQHLSYAGEFNLKVQKIKIGMSFEDVKKIYPGAELTNCPKLCYWTIRYSDGRHDNTTLLYIWFTSKELGTKVLEVTANHFFPAKSVTINDIANKLIDHYGRPTTTSKNFEWFGVKIPLCIKWSDYDMTDPNSDTKFLIAKFEERGDEEEKEIWLHIILRDERLVDAHIKFEKERKEYERKRKAREILDKAKF